MSHGEISAHKLPQMMIRVVSHEERGYHANSRAQSFHSLHTSLSVEVKRRSLATRPPEGFLQRDCSRILQLTDWETLGKCWTVSVSPSLPWLEKKFTQFTVCALGSEMSGNDRGVSEWWQERRPGHPDHPSSARNIPH